MIALRVYRALPKAYRLRFIQLLPPQRQLWLVRRLTRMAPRRAAVPVGQLRRVKDRGISIRALVATEATPAELWRRNLDLVTQTLESAGIDHFYVRHLDDLRSAVAVPLSRKSEVLRALTQAAARGKGIVLRHVNKAGDPINPKRAKIVQLFHAVTDPTGSTVLGSQHACEVEFWRAVPANDSTPIPQIVAPRGNQVAPALPAAGQTEMVPAAQLNRFVPFEGVRYRTRTEFTPVSYEQVTFPIDLVYTWVDGNDPDWQQRKNQALRENGEAEINIIAANMSRYISRDELRYSMRSVVANVPWIRQIYLVTDDQVPPWLDTEHPMVRVIRHREIFGDTGKLPTFNSHAIESRLHRIPGLSEHFIYCNDDMFFGRPLLPDTFFLPNGISKFFPSPAQLDVGPATIHDAPVTAAGKNNRRHIEERFGRTITQKMRHVPYPLRKSVLEEIEQNLTKEVLGTASHQFRHPEDLSIPSSLQHYWSYFSGRAVPGPIEYTYADLAHPSTPVKLALLLARRHSDVFCLNDTESSEVLLSEQHAMLTDFLSAYFPFRAPFELPAEVEAERAKMTASARAEAYLPPAPTIPAPRGAADLDATNPRPAGQPERVG
ncbi:stealth family protein [Micromonospora sp. HM5-17]|uniref:stealth family protein n=1 Tax=Micromonospora sp. HM5-17 TaxID=2487710 RepID=UPI001F314D96|nr:stealth family protein [Micromonospora sp. HM5-17]